MWVRGNRVNSIPKNSRSTLSWRDCLSFLPGPINSKCCIKNGSFGMFKLCSKEKRGRINSEWASFFLRVCVLWWDDRAIVAPGFLGFSPLYSERRNTMYIYWWIYVGFCFQQARLCSKALRSFITSFLFQNVNDQLSCFYCTPHKKYQKMLTIKKALHAPFFSMFTGKAVYLFDGIYLPAGIPVGWMYPNFQASKMQMNSKIENPTRKASALAMPSFLAFAALLGFSFSPPLSINSIAAAKLHTIAMSPIMMIVVMDRIMAWIHGCGLA